MYCLHSTTDSRIIIERGLEMRQDDFRREIIIDYICKLSGERVNPLPLFNEKEYRFQDLRGIAFRWFCINHKSRTRCVLQQTMIEAYKKYITDHNIKWNE